MRHRWFIFVAVLLLVLIGGSVAAFAYDSSRDDLIAEGVTIAGVIPMHCSGLNFINEARVQMPDNLMLPTTGVRISFGA